MIDDFKTRPPRRRPPDFMADTYDNLCASRFEGGVDEGRTIDCPVCGEPCGQVGCEAIEIQPQDGWKCYRPGRRFWMHADKTCITEWERGGYQDGDVRPFSGQGAKT